MKIVWRKRARNDVTALVEFVAQDSPAAAVRLYQQIEYSVGFLADWPLIGRVRRRRDIRELVVPHTPYIVIYRRRHRTVYVLRVMHGSRSR